jgi:hypothetical protein
LILASLGNREPLLPSPTADTVQHRGGGHGAGPSNFVPIVLSSGLSTPLLPKGFVS